MRRNTGIQRTTAGRRLLAGLMAMAFAGAATTSLAAQERFRDSGDIFVQETGTMVTFVGSHAKKGGYLTVTIDGPDGQNVFTAQSKNGLVDWVLSGDLADGEYNFEVWYVPGSEKSAVSDDPAIATLEAADPALNVSNATRKSGKLEVQAGLIVKSSEENDAVETSSTVENSHWLDRLAGRALNFLIPEASAADVSTSPDGDFVTVDDSPQVYFEDTSVADGFDWQIDASETTFRIDEGTTNAMFLLEQSTGDAGFGTTAPDTSIQINDTFPNISFVDSDNGNRDYELLNNSGIFFLLDRTTPSTPINVQGNTGGFLLSLNNDRVGVGNFVTPQALLHVRDSGGEAQVLVEDTGGTDGQTMFSLLNGGGHPKFRLQDGAQSDVRWEFRTAGTEGASERFQINKLGSGAINAEFLANGNLTIAGTLNTGSSRSIKDDITPVDSETLLAKLDNLAVSEWSYSAGHAERHVGPMAEDFHAIFGLGPDDKHISPNDLAGVALAAAKALKADNDAKDQRIMELEARMARLEALLAD